MEFPMLFLYKDYIHQLTIIIITINMVINTIF